MAHDVLGTRAIRGPSEGELLRSNPFKNYSKEDLDLSSLDPLSALPPPPPASSTIAIPPKLVRAKSSSKSTSTLSSSSGKKIEAVKSAGTERVACDLKSIYPSPGVEFSFEEIKLASNPRYSSIIDTWNDWEHFEAWSKEVAVTNRTFFILLWVGKGLIFEAETSWTVDRETGWPILYHPSTHRTSLRRTPNHKN